MAVSQWETRPELKAAESLIGFCHTGWTAMGMPLAHSDNIGLHCLESLPCLVHNGWVTMWDRPAAPRRLNQRRTGRARWVIWKVSGAGESKSESVRNSNKLSLFSLYGVGWSHVVTGDVTFLSSVDRTSLPPVAFPEERRRLEMRNTRYRHKGMKRKYTYSKIYIFFFSKDDCRYKSGQGQGRTVRHFKHVSYTSHQIVEQVINCGGWSF